MLKIKTSAAIKLEQEISCRVHKSNWSNINQVFHDHEVDLKKDEDNRISYDILMRNKLNSVYVGGGSIRPDFGKFKELLRCRISDLNLQEEELSVVVNLAAQFCDISSIEQKPVEGLFRSGTSTYIDIKPRNAFRLSAILEAACACEAFEEGNVSFLRIAYIIFGLFHHVFSQEESKMIETIFNLGGSKNCVYVDEVVTNIQGKNADVSTEKIESCIKSLENCGVIDIGTIGSRKLITFREKVLFDF